MKLLFFMTSLLSFACLFAAAVFYKGRNSYIISRRLHSLITKYGIEGDGIHTEEAPLSFKERIIAPMLRQVKQKIVHRMSRETEDTLRNKLADAGNPFGFEPSDFQLVRFILGASLFMFVLVLFLPSGSKPMQIVVFAIMAGMLGWVYPYLWLKEKSNRRMKELQKEMPDFFDMVNVTIEAGLGLDAAISKVSKQMNGPLSHEFMRSIDEMRLGKSRREAFTALRERIPLESFQNVMSALIQADQLGLGMSKVLRAQTTRIREQRRQLAREQAMKAPVKMMIPMVLFIFPTLFIVLLGPIVIKAVTEWF